ncbi:hypothetical protein CH253_07955 [Rhodococcus sp. 06-156-3C]|uniref:DUF2637 domain-containing protein n=1 Tax=Rhodococcus sp. 06-156-3C TaxID=2022486 RepID=UPI000B9BE38C|nr:DUF2637 domain-containing protein [Rhodococcus sp. 06-156-3C]OZD23787.1 hypothetical protein CH253_07955 [Rhodococcus sp. 06-156-3C]
MTHELSPKARRIVLAFGIFLTASIATGAFVLSFAGLTDLAVRYGGMSTSLAWIWPLIVDGTIIGATLTVVLSPRSFYAWSVLIGSALISIVGNGVHAESHGPVGIAIATVPPVLLLVVTHLMVHLSRLPLQSEAAAPAVTETRPARPVYLAHGNDPQAPDLARSWRQNHGNERPAPATADALELAADAA